MQFIAELTHCFDLLLSSGLGIEIGADQTGHWLKMCLCRLVKICKTRGGDAQGIQHIQAKLEIALFTNRENRRQFLNLSVILTAEALCESTENTYSSQIEHSIGERKALLQDVERMNELYSCMHGLDYEAADLRLNKSLTLTMFPVFRR